ncbi:ATPase [Reticulibacter mediterranei]|uniref:ATPase n=1 Tax=Reticulibacter mediterranei TaxID=2778369 RepID=A0A8J3IB97_9CHLR|nr:SRPBCC family protein [Reticulibacter mediterranei]GHO90453.1 ATPase [Reticulibacter mediterranei]
MAGKNKTIVTAEPGKQEMIITREFDAPRELVFKAFTDPELVPQWWGPRRLSTLVDKMDVRSGGLWRFINQDPDGNEYGFHGVYHEVCAPERIIDTFEFEGLPEAGHVCLETLTLEALPGGRTRLTAQSVFQSVADRDGALQSGMEEGLNDSYARLTELLETMK